MFVWTNKGAENSCCGENTHMTDSVTLLVWWPLRLVIRRDLQFSDDSKWREVLKINTSICVMKNFYKNVNMDQTQNHLDDSPMSYFKTTRFLGYEVRRRANDWHQHSANVMNEWSHTSLPLLCLHDMDRDYFRLYKDVLGLVTLFEYCLITCRVSLVAGRINAESLLSTTNSYCQVLLIPVLLVLHLSHWWRLPHVGVLVLWLCRHIPYN